MKAKQALISIFFAIGLLGSGAASAAFFGLEAVNDGPNGPIAAHVMYDAASQTFTTNTPFGFPTDPATIEVFQPQGGPELIPLVGTFLMIADIDNGRESYIAGSIPGAGKFRRLAF